MSWLARFFALIWPTIGSWILRELQKWLNSRVDKKTKKAEQKAKNEDQLKDLKEAKTNEERIKAADRILNNR